MIRPNYRRLKFLGNRKLPVDNQRLGNSLKIRLATWSHVHLPKPVPSRAVSPHPVLRHRCGEYLYLTMKIRAATRTLELAGLYHFVWMKITSVHVAYVFRQVVLLAGHSPELEFPQILYQLIPILFKKILKLFQSKSAEQLLKSTFFIWRVWFTHFLHWLVNGIHAKCLISWPCYQFLHFFSHKIYFFSIIYWE